MASDLLVSRLVALVYCGVPCWSNGGSPSLSGAASQLPVSLQCPSSGFNRSLTRLLKCKEYNVPQIFFYTRETVRKVCYLRQPTRLDWIGVLLSSSG